MDLVKLELPGVTEPEELAIGLAVALTPPTPCANAMFGVKRLLKLAIA